MEKYITALIRNYLKDKQDQIRPTNLDLAAFMVAHTIEALTHAAVHRLSIADGGWTTRTRDDKPFATLSEMQLDNLASFGCEPA